MALELVKSEQQALHSSSTHAQPSRGVGPLSLHALLRAGRGGGQQSAKDGGIDLARSVMGP